jgi:hypothetical protein|uniref:Uncharacterized protein n=1 Tax=viral metagenome TaxID=1070528 RepID=A0A6C0AMG6_9ZZZZ
MKIDITLFNEAQKQRRQTLYKLIFDKRLTISSIKKQLIAFLETTKESGIKRKIKNDLEFLNHQFEFRKRSYVKKRV